MKTASATAPVIDLAASPRLPYENGPYTVEFHDAGTGSLAWNPNRVELFRISTQRGAAYVSTLSIEAELLCLRAPVLNANVLDWLLEHPADIPEKWRLRTRTHILFWGTKYRFHSEGRAAHLVVRSLYCTRDRYESGIISVCQYQTMRNAPAAALKQ